MRFFSIYKNIFCIFLSVFQTFFQYFFNPYLYKCKVYFYNCTFFIYFFDIKQPTAYGPWAVLIEGGDYSPALR